MKNINNPFINKNVRTVYVKEINTYYYCVNDVCAMLINGTYYQGKNYWKSLKSRNNKFNINNGYVRTKMKLPATDGKFYFSDVISHKELIALIKLVAHKNAIKFKNWLSTLTQFEYRQHISEVLGVEQRNNIMSKIKNRIGYVVFCKTYIGKVFNLNCSSTNKTLKNIP
jgi:hypothetical protein